MDGSKVAAQAASGKPDNPVDRWRAALATRGLTYREKVLYLALAWHDGKEGAFPSFDTLAETAAMKRFVVAETLKSLEAKGVITRQRTQRSNRYTIAYGLHSQENPDGGTGESTVRKNRLAQSGKS